MPDSTSIPFARPFVGPEEEAAVLRVLRSGWLTTGAETLTFEKEFSSFLQSSGLPDPSCLAVNSATSGLHLALEACTVQSGDMAFVPSYTFTSSAAVLGHLGADPVFVDLKPGTFHMDPQALEDSVKKLKNTKKIKAIIPVHYGGLSCDMDAIMSVARQYNLKVIEDTAHAFPSLLKSGQWAGTIGDAGVFSFYTTKTLCTGEGGMVATRDEAVAKRVSIMRSHGIDRSVWSRYTDVKSSWYYEVKEPGFKYNLPDLLSALGRVQLARALDLLKMRQEIAGLYDSAFGNDEHFLLPPTGPGDARHLYPLRLNLQSLRISRDEFIQKLQESGVGVSVHFIPLHTMPYYKNRYHLKEDDYPQTMKAFKQEISLPIWPGMEKEKTERVINVVKSIAGEYTE